MHIKIKKILKVSGILLGSFIFLFVLFLSSVYIGVFGPLPNQADLLSIHKEQASLVLASDSSLLGKYFAENRTNVSNEEIPQHLINALISTEDKRFFLHQGYDIRSYFRVVFKSILLRDKSSGGGSTLTQQLVKNLYGRNYHSFLSMPINKVKEAIIAARMEDVYSKEEILNLYLNSVPFGEEVFGIEAASNRYFDKHASELSIQEAAVLVGILKANTYYNPRLNPENATKRRNQVIELMEKEQFLNSVQSDSLKSLPLVLSYTNYQIESPAAYFVRQVKRRIMPILENIKKPDGESYDLEKDGLRIYTTLDKKLQSFAQKATKTQLEKMQKLLDQQLKKNNKYKIWLKQLSENHSKQELEDIRKREVFDWNGIQTEEISLSDSLWHYYKMLNAAVLIAEPSTGRVLTWIGGNNYRFLPYDMIFAKRQMASTVKPLIYTAALESGFTPCSYLSNEVKEYEQYDGWRPENYDKSYSSDTTIALWYALAHSINLPTVDLYFQNGHQAVADLLRRLQIKVPQEETPSIALGSLDISLYQMVLAYSTFANRGNIPDDLVMIDRIADANGNLIYATEIKNPDRVIQEDICDQLTSILERAINEGTGTQIRNRFGLKSDLAGKTGTAQNYSNAWFISYTSNLVIGTWVGAQSPEMHFQNGLGSGSALALPISGEILSKIENNSILKEKYLIPFQVDSITKELLNCPPFHEKGVSGFIHRLIEPDIEKEQAKTEKEQEKEAEKEAKKEKRKNKKDEKTKVGKFFEKIFGKKKK